MTDLVLFLGRSIQKHVRRLKTFDYSHPPIMDGGDAVFRVMKDGRTFRVTVHEVSLDEELDAARAFAESKGMAT